MKILHVSTPLTWRGGEQQLAYLVDELKEKGIEQEVLCAKGSAVERYCLFNKIAHHTFNRNNLQLVTAGIINDICHKNTISLIHAHDAHGHTAAVLSSIVYGNITPLVVSRRTIFPIGTNWFSKLKYNHSSVSRYVCVSERIKEQTSGSVKDMSKVVTVHSGIDLSRFNTKPGEAVCLSEFGTNLSRPFIGNIAAITKEKDFFTFVNTAEAYYKTGQKGTFFIIGEGSQRSQIEKYIKEKNLTGKIILTGFQNNIPGIMRQLDCFLSTSLTEGLGTSILDAMACRIPVVATRTGGVPEIVLNGHTGLLAPVRNADVLAECLINITRNHLFRRILIRGAHAYVYNFTKQKMASMTLEIYREVILEKSLEHAPVLIPSYLPL